MSDTTPQFSLQRIYIKDASFEAPNSPEVFTKAWQPQVNMDLSSDIRELEEHHFEVSLKVTVTAENDEKNAFLVEVMQAGVFYIANIEEEQKAMMLGAMCPGILFPYLRENIDNLVIKGGFPAIMLAPINFDALYQQKLQESVEAENAEDTKH